MSRSPIRTVTPPIRAGSTAVRRETVVPVSDATRAAMASVSSALSGAALVTTAAAMPR